MKYRTMMGSGKGSYRRHSDGYHTGFTEASCKLDIHSRNPTEPPPSNAQQPSNTPGATILPQQPTSGYSSKSLTPYPFQNRTNAATVGSNNAINRKRVSDPGISKVKQDEKGVIPARTVNKDGGSRRAQRHSTINGDLPCSTSNLVQNKCEQNATVDSRHTHVQFVNLEPNKCDRNSQRGTLDINTKLNNHAQFNDWPIVCDNKVLIHFNEPRAEDLVNDDSYFYVARNDGVGSVQLVLRHVTNGNIQEFPLTEEQSSDIFAMDKMGFVKDIVTHGDEDISHLLSQCLVAAENGLERMTWDKVKLTALRSRDTSSGYSFRILPAIQKLKQDERSPFQRKEARACYRKCADGTLVKIEEGVPRIRRLEVPVRLSDVQPDVLMSGAAVLTSFLDSRGGAVVLLFCKHPVWETEAFTASELAKLLLYYQSIPSDEARRLGLTVVVDARSTSLSTINCLLEGLYIVEASLSKALHIVHVLVDKAAQVLFFRSPVFRPQGSLNIDLVSSIDTLYKFLDRSRLPPQLGGSSPHDHRGWVQFRMKLDPFLSSCRAGAQLLVGVMAELSSTRGMPHTSQETRDLLRAHEQSVRRALEEPVLEQLQLHGEDTLTAIKEDMMARERPQEYRAYYEGAKRLFSNVKDSMYRLVKLADDKLHRLEQCLRLRQFEERASQIINWLCTDGEDLLKRHAAVADNLKAIRAQQAEFDKAYFAAMTEQEKGEDLVTEGSLLAQSQELDQVSGIKEISKELRMRMTSFCQQLDQAREKIADTAQCYQLLDKCYEWALEAMKYLAGIKMATDMNAKDIDRLLSSLDLYLTEHPSLDEQIFVDMDSLVTKLDNEKLQEQCKVAHSRCVETEQLLHIRHATLKKAREQIEAEEMLEQERRDSVSNLGNGAGIGNYTGHINSKFQRCPGPQVSVTGYSSQRNAQTHAQISENNFGPVRYRQHEIVRPPSLSSPVGPSLDYVSRRRSYAGKPSAPVYSPNVAAFKENLQGINLREYEEHLLYEGLITEDMSDRIVASLPKGLNHATSRSSRESLRGSHENMHDTTSTTNTSTPTTSIPISPLCSQSTSHIHSPTRTDASTLQSKSTTSFSPQTGSTTKSRRSGLISHYSAINALTVMLNRHSKPHKKIMRRSTSLMMPTPNQSSSHSMNQSGSGAPSQDVDLGTTRLRENPEQLRDERTGKTLSLATSTDSLPSLPEEDPVDTSAATEKRNTWTPVADVCLLQHRANNPQTRQSMTDLRVAGEEIRRTRQLQLIMTEMVDTERDYVRALQMIIDNYLPEMVRDDVPQSLRGKRNIVFGNIEHIHEFHQQHFLTELEQCKSNPYRICYCFLKHEEEFYLYALFNKNKPKSDHLMIEHHGRAFFRQKQLELGDKMDLSSYLLKPVQRMGKYSLLLKQIIKLCPPSEPEYPDLKQAYDVVKFQLRHGNDLLAMDCLVGADVNLNEQGMLLRQDTFLVWHGRRKAMRHVFLFEEMVVFSKTKRTETGKEVYSYKSSIKTSDLGLTENVGDNSRYRFEIWFRKRSASDTFTLQAPSSEVKSDWVLDISRMLWKQAIRNREMRLAEMQRMGAGSKPCIDLKPSKDNIHDRFVNISLANRRPKARSSIAVSSVDHLKNGNKRPHSLISVSSTSSSSSSGMYGGGPLSITFEAPNEYEEGGETQPSAVPRSATICSNESGIVDDIGGCSNPASPKHLLEDACTQTTLRRPPKQDISKALASPTQDSDIELQGTRLASPCHDSVLEPEDSRISPQQPKYLPLSSSVYESVFESSAITSSERKAMDSCNACKTSASQCARENTDISSHSDVSNSYVINGDCDVTITEDSLQSACAADLDTDKQTISSQSAKEQTKSTVRDSGCIEDQDTQGYFTSQTCPVNSNCLNLMAPLDCTLDSSKV